MPDDDLPKEFELLLEKKLREIERTIRSEADRARNQAIGALGFFALVLSVVGFFGGSALVKLWARDAATTRIEKFVPQYTSLLQAAAKQAKADAGAARQASKEIAIIKDLMGSGEFTGDLAVSGNRWGECQWVDFSEEHVGKALERLGRGGVPDFGCPDGTFMTHIDYDDAGGGHKVVRHTRCCKP